jgi:nitroreductase
VGLFFCLDRKLGPPQWADLGMYMQNVMLLAVERGLDTCPQEYWARYPKTVGGFLGLPDDHMVFAGMALGHRDAEHPINRLKASRDAFELWGELRGFA